jgi:hypothetical protein
MKWDKGVDNIAGDIIGFVDDLRSSGRAEEESWQISRQVASRLQYLGIQDAPRKRRPPVQNPGAWAGAFFSTSKGKITQIVGSLCAQLAQDPKSPLNYKELERTRGSYVI